MPVARPAPKSETKRYPFAAATEGFRDRCRKALQMRYCILSRYEYLPGNLPECLHILAEEPDAMVQILGLGRLTGSVYSLNLGGELKKVAVYGHNQNVLPSLFETKLIHRAVVKYDVFKVPCEDDYWKLRLYWQLVYEKLLVGQPDRAILMEALRKLVGNPIIPKASNLIASLT